MFVCRISDNKRRAYALNYVSVTSSIQIFTTCDALCDVPCGSRSDWTLSISLFNGPNLLVFLLVHAKFIDITSTWKIY